MKVTELVKFIDLRYGQKIILMDYCMCDGDGLPIVHGYIDRIHGTTLVLNSVMNRTVHYITVSAITSDIWAYLD